MLYRNTNKLEFLSLVSYIVCIVGSFSLIVSSQDGVFVSFWSFWRNSLWSFFPRMAMRSSSVVTLISAVLALVVVPGELSV